MRCACIDIGSNTTRLLVADPGARGPVPVLERKAFTRLGRVCRPREPLPDDVVAVLAAVVAEQADAAREAGASALRVVATAALRRAANGAEVCAALRAAADADVDLLSGEEEARLAFAGATAALRGGGAGDAAPDRAAGVGEDEPIGVADVGGGSSELVVGTLAGGVSWSCSLAVGSGDLADAHLRADPPAAAELAAIRAAVADVLRDVAPPPVARAVAVGGSATSLARLVGPLLDCERLDAAVAELCAAPSAEVAARRGLDPERVRLLPAGLLVLAGVARLLGPLSVGRGGLREGVVLRLAARA